MKNRLGVLSNLLNQNLKELYPYARLVWTLYPELAPLRGGCHGHNLNPEKLKRLLSLYVVIICIEIRTMWLLK